MEKIKKFNTIEEFYKKEYEKPFLYLIDKEISVLNHKISTIKPMHSNCGDILFYDKKNKYIFLIKEKNISYFTDNTLYQPIGIVVVPGTHNIYGDNTCSIMSLVNMRYDTPYKGGEEQNICFGNRYTSVDELVNYNEYIITDDNDPQTLSVNTSSNLPTDYFNENGINCLHNTNAYYNENYTNKTPSPYLTNDKRNYDYSNTSISPLNALSDFNGKNNTNILTNDIYTSGQTTWKTDDTIINDYGNGLSPAACCCRKYKTNGTESGDWYMPSLGELGYIISKLNKINEVLSKLKEIFPSEEIYLLNNKYYYWSSTEQADQRAHYISTENGAIGSSGKGGSIIVRSLLNI